VDDRERESARVVRAVVDVVDEAATEPPHT
jgi:hypothetical protein